MTTYFFHHPDGSATSYPVHLAAPVCNPYHDFASGLVPYPVDGSPAGAPPIVSSNMVEYKRAEESASGESYDEWHETDDGYYSENAQSPAYDGYVGYAISGGSSKDMTAVQYPAVFYRYPDTESIRDYHSLHTLLPYIQPGRLHNSIWGPTLDILEEGTLHKFATAVPKKMLVLFCGRKVVNRFLRTFEREDMENWEGGPIVQELRLPRNHTNHIGVKIVIAWMELACREHRHFEMKPIRVPNNLFAALSLSRALTTFGLHRDANRVDNFIASHHYNRPVYPDEIISIWNCLPKDSKYTYRMIEDLRRQRDEYENGNKKAFPDAEKVLEFLEAHPDLKARVDDKEYNDSEEFQPFFGTEWCVRAAHRTEQMMASMTPMYSTVNHTTCGTVKQQNGHPQSGRPQQPKQQKARSQPRKHGIALNDWEPKATPAAWPEFEKTVVLRIVEPQEKVQEPPKDRVDSANGGVDGSSQ